nr:MAG TPA: hypothetical protein [Caudoviricetes sp.]
MVTFLRTNSCWGESYDCRHAANLRCCNVDVG